MQFQLNDFCLKFKALEPDRPLPLERIEGLDLQSATTRNRFGVTTSTLIKDLLDLDNTYAPVLWDELILLEKRISFLTECLADPTEFRFVRSKGVIKIFSTASNIIVEEKSSWLQSVYDLNKTESLSEARLEQISNNLDKLEETHDFLVEAIKFIR